MSFKKLKAARLHKGSSKLSIEEVARPQVGPGEALIRTRAAGVCHTDLHFLEGLIPLSVESMTLGHEIAGEVVEVGEGVFPFKSGDRVIVDNCVPCNACSQCLEGRDNLCDNLVQLGFNTDGGYAEYLKVRADSVIPLPGSIEYAQGAALTCGVAACYHAMVDIGRVAVGETVLINGMGGLGFSALQLAKISGATAICVDVVQEKLDRAAKEFKADQVINAREESGGVARRVNEVTRGRGVDIVLELVGRKETMSYSVDVLAKSGRVVIVGYSKADFVLSPLSLILKEGKVFSSVAYRKSNLFSVRNLTASGELKPLIAGEFMLDQVNDALAELNDGKLIGRPMIRF